MNFKEDWWIPVLIILGFLFLYQIYTQGNNTEYQHVHPES
jgi:hypothetical protein